ncbi:hypothetical protein [Pseudoalteromonas denitrificans]|uniref:Uncharacterized protein n=1 Tax=Pseudoalteromonas denitrificans DSM 6059 TaxID=1123010 RepID=A0A1I1TS74_9GAMM|nr:hypothetical protein [Pseudoalteromonas denitrificans]SFD61457.1 hypothetical protein SAMN02745724_04978 [Pseudoalteromonas denitrificans DSM 6059]
MMNQKNMFYKECYRQLYNLLNDKKKGIDLKDRESKLQGFIAAGDFLKLITRAEVTALYNKAHFEIFNESVSNRNERKKAMQNLKAGKGEAYFEIPAVLRNN